MSEETKLTCPHCLKGEPDVRFARRAVQGEPCQGCLISHGRSREGMLKEAERHKHRKMVRDEVRKIAKRRIEARKQAKEKAKRRAAIERFVPREIPEAEKIPVDPATKELAARTLQRRRLIEFIKAFHPKYKDGWVHHDICRRLEKFLEDVAAQKSPRLMLLVPPRHGKSEIGSKGFPAWGLGKHPDFEFIATSYNVSLALEFSRSVRSIVRSDKYQLLFPNTRLSEETQSAETWKIATPTGIGGGGYIAAGIGGPITGKGAHVLIVDDPVKNAEEADSPEVLKKIWDWFTSTAYTRLAPGGGILVIMTWWSDLDLAGTIQTMMKDNADDEEIDHYEIVRYPAIAEEDEEFRLKGEPLHPERYSLAQLTRIKRQLGGDSGRWWNALYQQNPIPMEGAMFKREDIIYRDENPSLASCYLYCAWDFALGEKRTNDWTVGGIGAVDSDGKLHMLDASRFRSSDQVKVADTILNYYQDNPNVKQIGVEDGHIWKGIKPHLDRRMRERQLYPTIVPLQPLTDKLIRAQPLQGMIQSHMVTFPRGHAVLEHAIGELLRFPGGRFKDSVDMMSWLARLALMSAPPPRARVPRRRQEKTVAEKLRALAVERDGKSHLLA